MKKGKKEFRVYWSDIRVLGKNKIVQSSYFWFAIVPLAANFLSEVSDIFTINIGNNEFGFTLKLPFSWQLFYFSALSFSIANIIFQVFCPSLIKEYRDYSEVEQSKKSELQLYKYACDLINNWIKSKRGYKDEISELEIKQLIANNFYAKRQIAESLGPNSKMITDKYRLYSPEGIDLNEIDFSIQDHTTVKDIVEVYENIVELQNKAHKKARISAVIFYAIGLALVSLVFLQNLFYVFKNLFN